jgi:hypothetical protein
MEATPGHAGFVSKSPKLRSAWTPSKILGFDRRKPGLAVSGGRHEGLTLN